MNQPITSGGYLRYENVGSSSRKNDSFVVTPVSALELLIRNQQRKSLRPLPCLKSNQEQKRKEEMLSNNDVVIKNCNNNAVSPSPIKSSSTTEQQQQQLLLCLLDNPYFTLPVGTITEIAGPAGAGKTQIALSLCVDALLCSTNQTTKVVYIALGGSSNFLQTISYRLNAMIQTRLSNENHNNNNNNNNNKYTNNINNNNVVDETSSTTTTSAQAYDYLTRIFLRWICNTEELMELLQVRLPKLLGEHSTSVVIIDGISNLFRIQETEEDVYGNTRTDNSSMWHQQRAITFFQISNLCKLLSTQFQSPFVIINQATTRIIENDDGNTTNTNRTTATRTTKLEPALGLAWSQCVNSTFFVTRKEQQETLSSLTSSSSRRRRLVQCLKAPHISSDNSFWEFTVDQSGCHSMNGATKMGSS
jgi:hypothetical protein